MNVARSALPAGAALLALTVCLPAWAFGPPAEEGSSAPEASESAPQDPQPVDQDPAPDPGPDPVPDSQPDPRPDPLPDPQPDPDPNPDSEGQPQPDRNPRPQPRPQRSDDDDDIDDIDSEPSVGLTIPRVDGAYFGTTLAFDLSFTSVLDLETPDPFLTGLGLVSVGQSVLPWLYLGVSAGGGGGSTANGQLTYHGGFVVSGGLYPVPKYPFSVRLGLGFGAGAVTDPEETARFGFGGAIFQGAVRYEFFPLAKTLRPRRGGGWAIGPELGWLGYTPAAAGQPFTNNVYLGVSTGFYFGN